MRPVLVSAGVLVVLYGGALIGFSLQSKLPEHHHDVDSRELRKVGTGLIATMAALVLGLLVASAKSAYDDQKSEVTHLSADVALLNRTLSHYGPEAGEARAILRRLTESVLVGLWKRTPDEPAGAGEELYDSIARLHPATDRQEALKSAAEDLAMNLGRTRWLLHAQAENSVSMALLTIVVFWLAIIFVNFGLQAKPNASVHAALLLSGLSVATAVFFILEMDHPFQGIIRLSDAPLRHVAAHLGR